MGKKWSWSDLRSLFDQVILLQITFLQYSRSWSWSDLRSLFEQVILIWSQITFRVILQFFEFWVCICFIQKSKKFLDVLFVVGLVFSRSSLTFYYRKTQECELKIGIVHACNLVFDRDLCSKVYCMIIDYVPQRLKPITL